MAEIRSYMKEKQKREQNKTDYRTKIRKHRLGTFLRVASVILAVAVLVMLVTVQYRNHIYTSYDVIDSVEQTAIEGTTDIRLGDTILTYSKDGAHCTDARGNILWNQTYEIQDVVIDVCENVAVIAAYNGRDVYVVSSQKVLGNFTTNLPIREAAVSSSGRVAIIMADTNITYINTYTMEGKLEFEGQATMSSSGYPLALSLSPDGELMQISYMYLDAGVQKSKVAFYNLGPVGANHTDYMVSVHEYTNILIPYVEFMNDQTAFAVGDSQIMLYYGGQKPVPLAEFSYEDEVQSVFYNEEYVGLVFYSDSGKALYKMNVYDGHGTHTGTYYFNIDYTDIVFKGNDFIVYNDSECLIMTMNQEEKYSGTFEKGVRCLLPLRSSYKYLLVTGSSLDTIQLK